MALTSRIGKKGDAGFTLMELVVVLFIVALLAALAVPNVSAAITRARESTLEQNLTVMRRAIDDFHADREEFPATLSELVDRKYIKFIPEDPITSEVQWQTVEADGGVSNVHSTSGKIGTNGVPYSEW